MSVPFRMAPALLLLASALMLLAGVRMAGAGMAAYQAEAFMTHWAMQRQEPEERSWAVAATAARRAQSLYPAAHGGYEDTLGRVYAWRFYQRNFGPASTLAVLVGGSESPAIEASRRQALAAFRDSTRLRPSVADSWARLAHAKLYLLEIDDEFAHAYAAADRLAAPRGSVQLEIVGIGFQAWIWLSPNQQDVALKAAVAVLAGGGAAADEVSRQAAAVGVSERICARANQTTGVLLEICQG